MNMSAPVTLTIEQLAQAGEFLNIHEPTAAKVMRRIKWMEVIYPGPRSYGAWINDYIGKGSTLQAAVDALVEQLT